MKKRDDGHGPYETLLDARVRDIARAFYALRASELEGVYLAREVLAWREGDMGQSPNASTLALVNVLFSTIRRIQEHVDALPATGYSVLVESDLRFAEMHLSALVQRLDQIETICTDAVRDDATAEEIYHRVTDVLHAARVAPSGQKGPTE